MFRAASEDGVSDGVGAAGRRRLRDVEPRLRPTGYKSEKKDSTDQQIITIWVSEDQFDICFYSASKGI